jgi:glycosyltransferase involved in cell wall biosynthesis
VNFSPLAPPWVIVTAGFHFTAGQAKAVAWLADYLARSGTPVHLVGNSFDPGLAARPGVTVHQVPRVRGADVVGYLFLARAGRAVARKVSRDHPAARVVVNGASCVWSDVNWVHYLHNAWAPDLSAAPRWFRLKERVVVGWYRRQERRAVRTARLVLTNSDRTTADVVRTVGVPADRVRTVFYGADPAWAPPTDEERRAGRKLFGLHPDRPVVAFVGGFGYDNRKGFDTLLGAWRKVCRSPGWDAELVMAGGGRAAAEMARRLAREGPAGRARMVGFTDRVFDLLAAADLLVSPVRYEPYGLNVQEAVCRGVPALVSAVAGVAEEYPPELAGMLLPDPNDADDLAARLLAWRADTAGWRARFRPLSERLRGRTWDDMAREIVAAVSAARA